MKIFNNNDGTIYLWYGLGFKNTLAVKQYIIKKIKGNEQLVNFS